MFPKRPIKMIDGSEKLNRQLAFELQNLPVFEKCTNEMTTVTSKTMAKKQKVRKNLLAKQQLWTCIMLFCTFLCRHYTTTTWKCLISHFVENVNTRTLNFDTVFHNSRKNWRHLMNWMRWNKPDKVWSVKYTF